MQNEQTRREIGHRLKECRLALGLSQPDVAAAVNRTPQAVSKWELGKSLPAADDWYTLGKMLGVSLDYLIYGVHMVPLTQSPALARIFARMTQREKAS